ncbi:MAG TPA: response regulator [Pyrinomonadaceae bacterium]|jgi:two-component system cell cycle response regulator DivK
MSRAGEKHNIMVLLVEDYEDTRDLMRMLLEMKGCRVTEAADGRAAVELAGKLKPSLILMDLNLPVLSGYEATRLILSDPELSNIPIVAFSAQCDLERRQQAVAAGCIECIQKPIDFNVIDEVVDRYLPK